MKKQSGFAILELALVAVVVVVVAAIGFYVYSNRTTPASSITASSPASLGYQSPTVDTPPAPQVTTASDLNSAMQALNSTSISSSNTDSSQLSSQSAAF